MVRRHRKIKWNNAGMSLVEVIVAITILGIVAVPVLHSLTTSMVYNSKARIRQDMTLKAESIMETFKGYDLESLQSMFSAGGSGIEGIQAGVDCAGYEAPADADMDNPDVNKVFKINGLKDAKNRIYDVTIIAKPKDEEKILEMKNVDSRREAIYTGKKEYDKEALKKAQENFAADMSAFAGYFNPLKDAAGNERKNPDGSPMEALDSNGNPITSSYSFADNVKNYIELYDRRLKFVIKEDGGNYVVTAKMVYRYCIKDFPYYIKVVPEDPDDKYLKPGETEIPLPGGGEVPIRGRQEYLNVFPLSVADYPEVTIEMNDEEEPVIYNNPTVAGLDRLIVYYYPQYDLEAENDIIEIDNQAGIDLSCYVIKQAAKEISLTRTETFESRYKPWVDGKRHSAGKFTLYHNFRENIGKKGSTTPVPKITGFDKEDSFVESDDFKENEVLSYDLELVVTNEAGNVVTKFESAMNEKIK